MAEALRPLRRRRRAGTAEDAPALAAAAGARLREGENWEDLFFRLLLERVEPRLGRAHPTFLTHWPAAQAALARRDPADPRVAERFELFVCGIELANAFVELTDADEQRARFVADRARRHALSGPDWPLDEDFLAALAFGMPPSAGIALGFDRLAMIASGATRIDQVQWLCLRRRKSLQIGPAQVLPRQWRARTGNCRHSASAPPSPAIIASAPSSGATNTQEFGGRYRRPARAGRAGQHDPELSAALRADRARSGWRPAAGDSATSPCRPVSAR